MAPIRTSAKPQVSPPPPPPVVVEEEEELERPRVIGGYAGPDRVGKSGRQTRNPDTGRNEAAPIYVDGDQYQPAGMSPELIARLQGDLVDAGLISTGKFQVGVWDAKTVAAFEDLLAQANYYGVTWRGMLAQMQNARDRFGITTDDGRGGRGGGGGGRQLQVQVSNPDDLRAAFRQVAYQRLGGKFLNDEQIDLMVSLYQGKERELQQAAFGGQAELEDMPSVETFADAGIRFADAGGEKATRMAGYGDMLMSMLGGGS